MVKELVRLENICKKYGENNIYVNTSYNFKSNSLTCILGPSGSGKTTLLNLLAGFDREYSGKIYSGSKDLTKMTMDELCELRFNNVGFIFQHYNLLKGYTCLENVLLGLNLDNTTLNEEKEVMALKLLEEFGLNDKANTIIDNLSGGQKQRVAIARALINDPQLILADEPTGALDEETSKAIMEILVKLSKSRTVIVITHDYEVANSADEIISLEDNSIKVLKEKRVRNETYGQLHCKEKSGATIDVDEEENSKLKTLEPSLLNATAWKLALKNFRVHFLKFFVVALLIAFGCAAFISALGSKSILDNAISAFKHENAYFSKASVSKYNNKNKDLKSIYDILNGMDGLENIYYQYNLKNITVKSGNNSYVMKSKSPTPIAKASMVYGSMPKEGANEIALSPNLAAKLDTMVKNLVGKDFTVEYIDRNGKVQAKTLRVSGIATFDYDDFVVSTKVEKEMYENSPIEDPTAISFNFKDFNEIPAMEKVITDKGINVIAKSKDVAAFKDNFNSTLNLFKTLSYLILVIFSIVSFAMLYKVALDRYTEIGLLASLGFNKKKIKKILSREGLILGITSTTFGIIFVNIVNIVYYAKFSYGFELSITLYSILLVMNMILTLGLTSVINSKITNTETLVALRGSN